MKIGPKYKIARRLGAEVFEKTQTQKFALKMQNKNKGSNSRRPRSRSNYGIQLLEKQKVRFTYALSEKQFSKYIKKVIDKNPSNPSSMLFRLLEDRLDNIILRAGFATTRLAARQLVSHGHINVNGVRVTIPSYAIKDTDLISIRERSQNKTVFADLDERLKEYTAPTWVQVDRAKKEVKVKGGATYTPTQSHFDLMAVLQFYKR